MNLQDLLQPGGHATDRRGVLTSTTDYSCSGRQPVAGAIRPFVQVTTMYVFNVGGSVTSVCAQMYLTSLDQYCCTYFKKEKKVSSWYYCDHCCKPPGGLLAFASTRPGPILPSRSQHRLTDRPWTWPRRFIPHCPSGPVLVPDMRRWNWIPPNSYFILFHLARSRLSTSTSSTYVDCTSTNAVPHVGTCPTVLFLHP